MGKKRNITILALGDRTDSDTYKKFHREKKLLADCGFEYISTDYRHFLDGSSPQIETDKVIVFLFFPFYYWNKYIEHKSYRGIYGNHIFYKKFARFWKMLDEAVKKELNDKKIFFINPPQLCGLYRDKLAVRKKLSQARIPVPELHKMLSVRETKNLLNRGHNFFLKPRYGSMGKGITFLCWSNWQTNFTFKDNRILSRKSDHGWKFRDITGNGAFLSRLLKKDILVEEAIDSLILKKMKFDLRIYTFFREVIYVYPRKNAADKITTNISQGGRGDPGLMKILPEHLIAKAKKTAVKVSKVLGLNLMGIDILFGRNLKDVYVIDVNVFPGFPKRRTFKLAQLIIKELARVNGKKQLHFKS